MTSASAPDEQLTPSPRMLMSQFWQKTHLRLQCVRNIVPEPPVPTSGPSSPKWGDAEET